MQSRSPWSWCLAASAPFALACSSSTSGDTGVLPPAGDPGLWYGDFDTGADYDAGRGDDAPSPATPPEAYALSVAFPYGVASGSSRDGMTMVWTQYTGTNGLQAVVWEYRDGSYFRETVLTDVTPADGGFVKVTFTGLPAGRRYRYVFFEVNAGVRIGRSPLGAFRQALPWGANETLRLGAISCLDHEDPFDVVGHAGARADIDLFLFLGDNFYTDAGNTLAEKRERYGWHLAHEEYRDLRASAGMLATWDDHEVSNDWDPETMDPAKLRASLDAFFEHMPLERVAGAPDRIWRSYRWGNTAEFFVLDGRSERLPSTAFDSGAQYLSPEQLAWLEAGLLASPSRFKVILNSAPITDMPPIWDVDQGQRWEGYGSQREDLLEFIDTNAIGGVVWVGGEFHLSFVGKVALEGPGATQWEIVSSPGAQRTNGLAWSLVEPQFLVAFAERTYAVIDLEPSTGRVGVRYVGTDGVELAATEFWP